MAATPRMVRVNELLKRDIADYIERLSFRDGTCLISLREVDTCPELTSAVVRFSIMPSSEELEQEALAFLRKKRKDIQKHVAATITLKNTPVLRFEVDKKVAKADNVLAIIEELERDAAEDQ